MYKLNDFIRLPRENWQASIKGIIIAWTWTGLWMLIEVGWPDLAFWVRAVGMALVPSFAGCFLGALLADLRQKSLTDPLTGLLNRRAFEQELNRALSTALRHGDHLSLLLIDIDGFKAVNDTQGHPVGDRLLRKVAQTIAATIREGDLVGRLGGDEFALILPRTPEYQAHSLIKRLRDQVRTHCGIHVSVGIASHPRDGETGDALLALEDQSLYRQKIRSERDLPQKLFPDGP